MYMDVVPPLAPLNMEIWEELKMDCSADVSLRNECQINGVARELDGFQHQRKPA